jgi:XTP/dITP diphosphohydrolase
VAIFDHFFAFLAVFFSFTLSTLSCPHLPHLPMKIVLASNNPGKLQELQALLSPLACTLVAQGSLGVPESPEPYRTFVENALAKARNAAQHTGLPALADDAGLCVDAFGGLPGVDTAYYATQFGYPKSDDNNVRALLEQMQTIDQRRAALVSTLVAVRSAQDPEPLIAVGRVVGEIARVPVGEGGFGFDPVMYLPALGQTFAQLPPALKNSLSHRGQSAQRMLALMREHWLV